MINEDNWTHTQYSSKNYLSKISTGGELDQHNKFNELFFVSKFAGNILITEETFKSIKSALDYINEHFGHWQFTDLLGPENSSCSNCQAH